MGNKMKNIAISSAVAALFPIPQPSRCLLPQMSMAQMDLTIRMIALLMISQELESISNPPEDLRNAHSVPGPPLPGKDTLRMVPLLLTSPTRLMEEQRFSPLVPPRSGNVGISPSHN